VACVLLGVLGLAVGDAVWVSRAAWDTWNYEGDGQHLRCYHRRGWKARRAPSQAGPSGTAPQAMTGEHEGDREASAGSSAWSWPVGCEVASGGSAFRASEAADVLASCLAVSSCL
jgi:hypothetical protein